MLLLWSTPPTLKGLLFWRFFFNYKLYSHRTFSTHQHDLHHYILNFLCHYFVIFFPVCLSKVKCARPAVSFTDQFSANTTARSGSVCFQIYRVFYFEAHVFFFKWTLFKHQQAIQEQHKYKKWNKEKCVCVKIRWDRFESSSTCSI